MSADLRDEIGRLADQARRDSTREGPPPKPATERRSSTLVKVGLALAMVELVSLGLLYSLQRREITTRNPQPNPLMSRNDCRGAVYRTYRSILAYRRDHDRPPASLQEMVGMYVDQVPLDPESGKALIYTSNGTGFTLRCPRGR